MRYADVRSHIQSGDVILFRGRGPVAWLIRVCQGFSDYDHSALAWAIGGRVLLIEARMIYGVKVTPLSTRLKEGATWISTGIPLDDSRLKVAIKDLGEPYSYENDIRALEDKPGIGPGKECAQLVAAVLGLPNGGWTPEGIREFFMDRPAVPLDA
jgi:hypothetical protein